MRGRAGRARLAASAFYTLRFPFSFLNGLGAIFSFISKDAVAKIQIMENYCGGERREEYRTLQAMVRYELSGGLVDLQRRSAHPDSGCRTVLRLHRALRWLQLFLEGLRKIGRASCRERV